MVAGRRRRIMGGMGDLVWVIWVAWLAGHGVAAPSRGFDARNQPFEEPRTHRSNSSAVEDSITAASALARRSESGGVPNRSGVVLLRWTVRGRL